MYRMYICTYLYQDEISSLLPPNTYSLTYLPFGAFNLTYSNKFIMLNLLTLLLVLLPLFVFPIAHAASVPSLPIVDLGYELHQASSFNVSVLSYLFNCIMFPPPTMHYHLLYIPQKKKLYLSYLNYSRKPLSIIFLILDMLSLQLENFDFVLQLLHKIEARL